MKIYPSLISGDILNIEKMIGAFDGQSGGYHLDVMDFHFVHNLTWGPIFINAIKQITRLPLYVHLMVDEPSKWLTQFRLDSDDVLIFHYEACSSHDEITHNLKRGRKEGYRIGMAINPGTTVQLLEPYFFLLDDILIMSVEPGFSGQQFLPEVQEKIAWLVEQRNKAENTFKIGVDGGVGQDNIAKLALLGVDHVHIASAIFSSKEPLEALKQLSELIVLKNTTKR